MRTIKVSEAVWAAIAERGEFGETEDIVLRRVFGLPPDNGDGGDPNSTFSRQEPQRRRRATRRMSAWVVRGELVVRFKDDGTERRWVLPDRSDKEAIRHVRQEAVAFALQHGASDPGQTNAVRKALTDGEFTRREPKRRRKATRRMSARVENGELMVRFMDDGTEGRWRLPDRSDKEAIRRVREEAVAFALRNGASDPGQTNAVRKALTDAGYHLTR